MIWTPARQRAAPLASVPKETSMSILRDAAVDYADIIDREAEPVGPIHPGVILEEELLEPLGLSAYALAKAIGVPRNRITGIVHGERAITADTALRLARFFDTSPDFWLGLQVAHDLEAARATLADRLDEEVIPRTV
jgi:antitoxin HigA-1